MENNIEKDFDDTSVFHEDFKDFDEEENTLPEIDEDLASAELEETTEFLQEEIAKEQDGQEEIEAKEEIIEKIKESFDEIVPEPQQTDIPKVPELSSWEELDDKNSVVKKYIFYVSKDFVPYIDKLTTDGYEPVTMTYLLQRKKGGTAGTVYSSPIR